MADNRIRDWSNLPSDLLSLITTRLLQLPDLVRFSSVCSQWRRFIIINNPQNPNHHPRPHFPWLFLPSNSTSTNGNLSFFSLSEHRHYTFFLPQIINHVIFTSAYGWLIAVSFDAEKKRSLISLVNPFTRRTIWLPPLSHPTPIHLFEKVKLYKSPPSNDNHSLAVIIVRLNLHDTYICQVGNSTWKKIHPPVNFKGFYTDYAIHNGQLFTIDFRYIITHVFDLDTCMCVAEIPTIWNTMRCYNLVDTPNGELFLMCGDTRLLRLEESEKERKWVNVESFEFGGYSLFQNWSQTMCFEPRGLEGWGANCIYFVSSLTPKFSCDSEIQDGWILDVKKNGQLEEVQLSFDIRLIDSFDVQLFVPSL